MSASRPFTGGKCNMRGWVRIRKHHSKRNEGHGDSHKPVILGRRMRDKIGSAKNCATSRSTFTDDIAAVPKTSLRSDTMHR